MISVSKKMYGLSVIALIAVWKISTCYGQGAPWTLEDQDIIFRKLKKAAGGDIHKEYKELYPDYQYVAETPINALKMLRLGFHDCLTYSDDLASDEINGCDGCLNPDGMGIDMKKTYGGKGSRNGPNVEVTNNNGLTFTADILEEIYTNPSYPKGAPVMDKSMKEKGYSRADLWAFGSLVAVKVGIDNNNYACQGGQVARKKVKGGRICGHIRDGESDCEIQWPRMPKFKTGRKDCTSPPGAAKPWYASRHEIHPRPHGNGPETVDFYRNNFGLEAKEAIALNSGAHAFADFHSQISQFRYAWARKQETLFNNQLVRHIALRPQYFTQCQYGEEWKMLYYGDSEGKPGNTSWLVGQGYFTPNKGPFSWFHLYNRCQASNDVAAINDGNNDPVLDRIEGDTPPECIENLEPGQSCKPECVEYRRNDETALSSDVGFYLKFQVSKEGRPMGCDGFTEDWVKGNDRITSRITCPKEDYAPEGVPLYQLVDQQADDQNEFMKAYIDAHEKMINNGYNANDLMDAPLDDWV